MPYLWSKQEKLFLNVHKICDQTMIFVWWEGDNMTLCSDDDLGLVRRREYDFVKKMSTQDLFIWRRWLGNEYTNYSVTWYWIYTRLEADKTCDTRLQDFLTQDYKLTRLVTEEYKTPWHKTTILWLCLLHYVTQDSQCSTLWYVTQDSQCSTLWLYLDLKLRTAKKSRLQDTYS